MQTSQMSASSVGLLNFVAQSQTFQTGSLDTICAILIGLSDLPPRTWATFPSPRAGGDSRATKNALPQYGVIILMSV